MEKGERGGGGVMIMVARGNLQLLALSDSPMDKGSWLGFRGMPGMGRCHSLGTSGHCGRLWTQQTTIFHSA